MKGSKNSMAKKVIYNNIFETMKDLSIHLNTTVYYIRKMISSNAVRVA